MGKRELLLIALFALGGVIAYKLTAPPASDTSGFSFGRLIRELQDEVRGHNYEVQVTRSATAAAPPHIRALKLDGLRGTITVVGETREDVAVEVTAEIYGADEAQARQFADRSAITITPADDALAVDFTLGTDEVRRRPRLEITVKAPRRLVLIADVLGGELTASHLGGVTSERGAGRARFTDIDGPVTGTFDAGTLEIERVSSVALETRRTEVRIAEVAGDLNLQATSGDLRVRDVGGATTLQLERTDGEIERTAGPVRATGRSGQLRLREARGAIEVDVTRMEVLLAPAIPVPITATTEFDLIELTLPEGGVLLDAAVETGQLRLPDPIAVEKTDSEQRARGPVRGGGPLVKLRTTRGDIVVR